MKKCPVCGYSGYFIQNEDGMLVCPVCGTVVESTPIENQVPTFTIVHKKNLEEIHVEQHAEMTTYIDKLIYPLKQKYNLDRNKYQLLKQTVACIMSRIKIKNVRKQLLLILLDMLYREKDSILNILRYQRVVMEVKGSSQLRIAQIIYTEACKCIKCKEFKTEKLYENPRKFTVKLVKLNELSVPAVDARGEYVAYNNGDSLILVNLRKFRGLKVNLSSEGGVNPVFVGGYLYLLSLIHQDKFTVNGIKVTKLKVSESGVEVEGKFTLNVPNIEYSSAYAFPGNGYIFLLLGRSWVYIDIENKKAKVLRNILRRDSQYKYGFPVGNSRYALLAYDDEYSDVYLFDISNVQKKPKIPVHIQTNPNVKRKAYEVLHNIKNYANMPVTDEGWTMSFADGKVYGIINGNTFSIDTEFLSAELYTGYDAVSWDGKEYMIRIADTYLVRDDTVTAVPALPDSIKSKHSIAYLGSTDILNVVEKNYNRLFIVYYKYYTKLDGYEMLVPMAGYSEYGTVSVVKRHGDKYLLAVKPA